MTTTPPNPGPDDADTNEDDEVVPLAVWPCAQTTAQRQRVGTYLPECREEQLSNTVV